MGKNSLPEQSFLAKALFDNVAESPDELGFKKGDVVTVYETDTNGLDGWWLCSLRGKHGIAPGNRLKVVAGLQENANNVTNQSFYETPPRGDRKRGSWDTPNKVVTPKKLGEVYVYQQQQNTSIHDYDVPPTRYNTNKSNAMESLHGYASPQNRNISSDCDTPDMSSMYDSPSKTNVSNLSHSDLGLSSLSLYSTPPSHKLPSRKNSDVYDVPPSRGRNNSLDSYDVPSNRSSMLSTHSSESVLTCSSSASNHSYNQSSSNPSSFCGSARSSMDISPQDLYDVPPSRPRPIQQVSHDSGLDMYDSPVKTKSSATSTPASIIEDYDVPKQHSIEKALELGMMELNTYNTPTKTKCIEHALDDFYDTPKNNTLRKDISDIMSRAPEKQVVEQLCVYDIPPQVTRDSVFSSRSDSTDGLDDPRLSSCSIDSQGSDIPVYDELPLDLDAAMDLLMKLQQDVQKSSSRLLSYVSSTWRVKDNLERRLYDIKQSCNAVKLALKEFVEFAQGSLANSSKLQDRKLIKKLYKQTSPLQQSVNKIDECLKNLDSINWQSTLLASENAAKEDDLGFIASRAKDLTPDVRKLASIIQGNSTLLFNRAGEMTIKRSDVKYENVKNYDKNGQGKTTPNSKPPIAPKGDHLKPGIPSKINIQQRPLPAPPSNKRPLPPTPDELKSFDLSNPAPNIYSVPKSDKDDTYVDSYEKKFEKAVDNIVQEYDYVQLENKDSDCTTPTPYTEPAVQDSDKSVQKEALSIPNLDIVDQFDDEVKRKLDNEMKDMMNKMSSNNDGIRNDTCLDYEDDLRTPVNLQQDTFEIPHSGDKLIYFGNGKLDPNDKQVLVFYSEQLGTHSQMLSSAIDQFIGCVKSNSPPKVFISRSKFIVLSAHKLVYIGDSLHRNLMNNDVRNKIMHRANQLCECLKMTVNATKVAALQYPSVPAVQDMVDRVVEVSQASHELKLVISQAAAL